jgi:hypothetical protein
MWSVFGRRYTDQYFLNEIVERATRQDERGPFYYYVVQLAPTYWPWMLTLILAVALWIKRRPRPNELVIIGAVWVGTWFVAITLFGDRKINYALPLYPMLAWMGAWGVGQLLSLSEIERTTQWLARKFWIIAAVLMIATIGLWLAPIQFQSGAEKNWEALMNWMEENKVDPARLTYAQIDLNDVCYVYLKTGRWMTSAAHAQEEGMRDGVGFLTKIIGSDKPAEDRVLFHSGPVYVLTPGSEANIEH